jgi:hypothetical protein
VADRPDEGLFPPAGLAERGPHPPFGDLLPLLRNGRRGSCAITLPFSRRHSRWEKVPDRADEGVCPRGPLSGRVSRGRRRGAVGYGGDCPNNLACAMAGGVMCRVAERVSFGTTRSPKDRSLPLTLTLCHIKCLCQFTETSRTWVWLIGLPPFAQTFPSPTLSRYPSDIVPSLNGLTRTFGIRTQIHHTVCILGHTAGTRQLMDSVTLIC